ncbi:hypothetical protein BU26DRAFT_427564 [Trematosphaeria pertusa]|uniref:DUF3253 domain-containing protein n=1 Tax=Trematosphaeria pertusa TaxID=390896 RepID=A0A6A6IGA0_9PLEO|nr:uncharacterized protein BU26DRAFT_427564 [Trematosphaeria pertusa]KAF2249217.1 hypothetical protein BU26DRAFT_427564 [Trematosphaeria pertusa]
MQLSDKETDIIEEHARRLLEKREWLKTICPSEIARALSEKELEILNASGWRDTMDKIRSVVWELRENGVVELLQKGQAIITTKLEDIHGPIRVRARQ